MIANTVQSTPSCSSLLTADKDSQGGLLTVFIGILIPVLFQKTVFQEGVNVC
jgi:hypothetical protein